MSLFGILEGITQLNGAQTKVGAIAGDRIRVTHVIGENTPHYTTMTFSREESRMFLSFGGAAIIGQ